MHTRYVLPDFLNMNATSCLVYIPAFPKTLMVVALLALK